MTAQVVIIVVLRRVNFLPGLLDHLLGSSHVSMPFTNIDSWPLGKSDYTKDDNGNDKQTFVNHGVPPGCECGFKTARALAIVSDFQHESMGAQESVVVQFKLHHYPGVIGSVRRSVFAGFRVRYFA